MSNDARSLSHTRWNCKYHIVFAPKYRRQVFYGEKRRAVGEILRKLCVDFFTFRDGVFQNWDTLFFKRGTVNLRR